MLRGVHISCEGISCLGAGGAPIRAGSAKQTCGATIYIFIVKADCLNKSICFHCSPQPTRGVLPFQTRMLSVRGKCLAEVAPTLSAVEAGLSQLHPIREDCGPHGSGLNGCALRGAAVGVCGWFGFHQHLPLCARDCACVCVCPVRSYVVIIHSYLFVAHCWSVRCAGHREKKECVCGLKRPPRRGEVKNRESAPCGRTPA